LEEYKKETIKDSTFSSSKRLKSNRIFFPPNNNLFQADDTEEIRKQLPPYIPTLTDQEYDDVIQYEKEQLLLQEKINKNPYKRFIDMVAGQSDSKVDVLITSPTGKPNKVGGLWTANGFSVGNISPIKSSKNNSNNNTPIKNETIASGKDDNRINALDVFDKDELKSKTNDYVNRKRMYNTLEAIENPKIIGIQDMSPVLMGNMRDAYTQIIFKCKGLRNARMEDFIEEDGTIAVLFAKVIASIIKTVRYDGGNRQQFEKNRKKFEHATEGAIQALKTFSFNDGVFTMNESEIYYDNTTYDEPCYSLQPGITYYTDVTDFLY